MAMTVMAAHYSIWKHLYDSMQTEQKPKIKLMFVTLDKESNMSTLWRREEFLRICSDEHLAKTGTENRGDNTSHRKCQETRCNLNPVSFFQHHFSCRRPDGITNNEVFQIACTLEFEMSINRLEGFQEVEK